MKMIKGIACVALGLSLAVGPLSAGARAATKGKVEKPARSAKKKQPKKLALRKGYRGGVFDQPVYNPATKSYFELVWVGEDTYIRWRDARIAARRRVWKGAHGRLAVVKSRHVNDFLRYTFRTPVITWIGLRYMCAFNKLLWVTGNIQPRTGFSYWGRVWNHNGVWEANIQPPTCDGGPRSYWPVHYWPVQMGFRWNANGPEKGGRAYFVEYPTGRR